MRHSDHAVNVLFLRRGRGPVRKFGRVPPGEPIGAAASRWPRARERPLTLLAGVRSRLASARGSELCGERGEDDDNAVRPEACMRRHAVACCNGRVLEADHYVVQRFCPCSVLGGVVRSLVAELKDCRVREVHSGIVQSTPGEPG